MSDYINKIIKSEVEHDIQDARIPEVSPSDEGKVLTVDSKGALEFAKGGSGGGLPSSTAADNSKVLSVNAQGKPEWDWPSARKVWFDNENATLADLLEEMNLVIGSYDGYTTDELDICIKPSTPNDSAYRFKGRMSLFHKSGETYNFYFQYPFDFSSQRSYSITIVNCASSTKLTDIFATTRTQLTLVPTYDNIQDGSVLTVTSGSSQYDKKLTWSTISIESYTVIDLGVLFEISSTPKTISGIFGQVHNATTPVVLRGAGQTSEGMTSSDLVKLQLVRGDDNAYWFVKYSMNTADHSIRPTYALVITQQDEVYEYPNFK